MKPFWTYMVQCSDGSYYVGHTDNLEMRIAQHNAGTYVCYTAERLPVKLVWSSEFSTRAEALERERQLKGWSRAKKSALICGDWEAIKVLSKNASTGSA